MEPPYVYQAVTAPTSIRLLRLLPNADPNTPLQGQLFECNIEEFYGQPNSYEALSYVWGVPEPGYSISLNGSRLPVTPNLYGALTHLRHRYREQLWWVDAICINQTDDREKERQIGLMYQIYACASCVIVWLGEGPLGRTEDGGQHVFEELLIARQKMLNDAKRDDLASDRIVRLFQRAWFRRIWVLQEVGAARRIQIYDGGGSVMDGYAFSEVLDLFRPSLKSRPELHYLLNITQSAAYLMRQSIFRRLYQGPGESPEGFFHFRQLIEMFHDREATKAQDKVFALLGMASKDMSKSRLLPDYKIDFARLFKRLVKFMISARITVECQGHEEAAVIKCTGYVAAEIQEVTEDRRFGNTTMIKLKWVNGIRMRSLNSEQNDGNDEGSKASSKDEKSKNYRNTWSIQATAVPLREGDLVCLLDGAKHPTIIRVCRDYSVVLVAAVWVEKCKDMSESDRRFWCKKIAEKCHSVKRNFTLVWDWNYSFGSDTFLDTYEMWAESRSWVSKDPTSGAEKDLDDLARCCDCALICIDGHRIESLEQRCKEVLSGLEKVIQSRELRTTGTNRFSAFLNYLSIRRDFIQQSGATTIEGGPVEDDGSDSDGFKDEPVSRIAMKNKSRCISQLCYWAAEERYETMTRLLVRSKWVAESTSLRVTTALGLAAKDRNVDVMERLLQAEADMNMLLNPWECEKVLPVAAGEGHLAVVDRLLQAIPDVEELRFLTADSEFRQEALEAAAGNGHLAVVERLLAARVVVNAPRYDSGGRTALQAAAGNGHLAVVERLIEAKADVNATGADREGKTALQAAAGNGYLAIVERLIEAKADVNAPPAGAWEGKTALQAAAGNGHLAVVERLIEAKADVNATGPYGVGKTALQVAAENGHHAVVERLIEAKAGSNAPGAEWQREAVYPTGFELGNLNAVRRSVLESRLHKR